MAEALRMNQTPSSNGTLTNSSAVSLDSAVESLEFKYTKVTFYFVILFCATFGNAMVVYVICTSKRMRSASHLLIMNLAVCDFFTPLISIPFDFALEENDYVWFYGDFMCKILYPAATFSTTASSLTLAAISLDRYRLLMHPFKKKLSTNQIRGIIIGIYIFCGAVVSPYTYFLNVDDVSCGEKWPKHLYRQIYTMTLFLFQYAIPLAFMTVMYTLAIRNLYATSGKVRHCSIHSNTRPHVYNDQQSTQSFVDSETSARQTRRGLIKTKLANMLQKRSSSMDENPNVKATKMFMAVVVVFAVFMFPNQVLWLWVDFGSGSEQPNYTQSAIICWLFTYTNSVVNPIIFAIFSKDFRVGFKGVFRLIFCCNQEALPERCHRFDCHTKSDSSTNEILKEKDKQTYDFSTCNTNVVDSDSSLSKTSASRYQNILYAVRDKNHNTGLKRVRGEPKPVLKVYPITQYTNEHISFPGKFQEGLQKSKEGDMTLDKRNENQTSNIKSEKNATFGDKSIIDNSTFGFTGEANSFIREKDVARSILRTDIGSSHDHIINLLPVLPPNTIDILDKLPETNC